MDGGAKGLSGLCCIAHPPDGVIIDMLKQSPVAIFCRLSFTKEGIKEF